MKKENNIEKVSSECAEEYGMGSVGEPKKYVPNKVKEVEGISNAVTID
jgi:hypothetical protein